MKTALIQMNATDRLAKNVEKALGFVFHAAQKKARFILLPEFFAFRGQKKQKERQELSSLFKEKKYGLPLKLLEPFCLLAREQKVFILAGSVYETVSSKGKGYNTAVFIDDQGKIRGTYRKQHLFESVIDGKKVKESLFFKKGRELSVQQLDEFSIGLSICYDLRFPDLFKKYRSLGVNVLCVPSSFSRKTGQAHWEVLLRCRAIENLCYVLAPNQVGKDSLGIPSYGNSMIVDPWGKILVRASGNKEEIIFADIKRTEVSKARALLPGIV